MIAGKLAGFAVTLFSFLTVFKKFSLLISSKKAPNESVLFLQINIVQNRCQVPMLRLLDDMIGILSASLK